MITIEFPILKIKIKGSTYTELFNTLMQKRIQTMARGWQTYQKRRKSLLYPCTKHQKNQKRRR